MKNTETEIFTVRTPQGFMGRLKAMKRSNETLADALGRALSLLEADHISQQNDLAERIEALEDTLDIVWHSMAGIKSSADAQPAQHTIEFTPKQFDGWSVNKGSDGKIRLSKRISGKPTSLYAGTVWNAEYALNEINAFYANNNLDILNLNHPSHFEGWIVGHDRGFIKMHKRIDGKVRSIYIGKTWDETDAYSKIDHFYAKHDDELYSTVVPSRIEGWRVVKGGDGRYRLSNGKTSIYVGSVWNEQIARDKIAKRNSVAQIGTSHE